MHQDIQSKRLLSFNGGADLCLHGGNIGRFIQLAIAKLQAFLPNLGGLRKRANGRRGELRLL